MPPKVIRESLTEILEEYEWHVMNSGCNGGAHPGPSLENKILPMFTDRWVSGPNQHTPEILRRIKSGLQLASRLLMEDECLLWFYKLPYGEHYHSSVLPGVNYIKDRGKPTAAHLAQVRANLKELGEVITFMHAPRSSKALDAHFALTYFRKYAMPFMNEFQDSDWPSTSDYYRSPRYKRFRPTVVLNRKFQSFFLKKRDKKHPSSTMAYHVLFTFATMLVHEVAHAYWLWLNPNHTPEPLMDAREPFNELGYSWMRWHLGRVIMPYHLTGNWDFTILMGEFTIVFERQGKRAKVWRLLHEESRMDKKIMKGLADGTIQDL
jgi:hypothetical protein